MKLREYAARVCRFQKSRKGTPELNITQVMSVLLAQKKAIALKGLKGGSEEFTEAVQARSKHINYNGLHDGA